MVKSQALKERSFQLRVLEAEHQQQRTDMKKLVVGALMIIAFAALLAQPTALVIPNNKNDDNSQIPTLLETVPRTLLSEIGEQSKSISAAVIGSPSTTIGGRGISPGKYVPFDCAKLLEDLRTNNAVQQADPNLGKVYARRTITDPSFYISVHNRTFDATRWDLITYGFYYERKLTAAFVDELRKSPPGARVLDVGGNIGFFSLVSAATGPFFVDTFEPNLKNRMRYCESLNMNQFTSTEFDPPSSASQNKPKTNLYPFGVGREEGTFVFMEHPTNPGQGAVLKAKTGAANPNSVQIITLDGLATERGWFQSRPDIAIFKVDVEGNEYQVIEGAHQLIKSKMIRNIFMEISVREPHERKQNIPMLLFLGGEANYKLHGIGGWIGPDRIIDWPETGEQLVNRIQDEAAKEVAKQLNLWWKVR